MSRRRFKVCVSGGWSASGTYYEAEGYVLDRLNAYRVVRRAHVGAVGARSGDVPVLRERARGLANAALKRLEKELAS